MSGKMRMFSGRLVDPLNLIAEEVRLDDICYALGNICRYGGHCHCHFSVAEHTLDVMDRVRLAGGDHTDELYAGLHDAGEAYTGDIPHPIKGRLGIAPIEEAVQKAVASAFGLDREAFKQSVEHGLIKYHDLEAGAAERDRLWTFESASTVANPRHWGRKLYHRLSLLMISRRETTNEQIHNLGIFHV